MNSSPKDIKIKYVRDKGILSRNSFLFWIRKFLLGVNIRIYNDFEGSLCLESLSRYFPRGHQLSRTKGTLFVSDVHFPNSKKFYIQYDLNFINIKGNGRLWLYSYNIRNIRSYVALYSNTSRYFANLLRAKGYKGEQDIFIYFKWE